MLQPIQPGMITPPPNKGNDTTNAIMQCLQEETKAKEDYDDEIMPYHDPPKQY